ncbi:hypothetical protein Csa_007672 [Cucumis sativus]|uniref:Uncharacterized protein n=1 Tax=Cucumis sativus TaxID=3659 RepID=A0A0A0M0L7_CUCSA|nr:hypothetical protein Csa_007672 [Cucumis sativus]
MGSLLPHFLFWKVGVGGRDSSFEDQVIIRDGAGIPSPIRGPNWCPRFDLDIGQIEDSPNGVGP